MSKLIKLKDSNGTLVYLNPDNIVLVSGAADKDGRVILGASNVLVVGGTIGILGSPEEVAESLNNPDAGKYYPDLLS
jgi:hypothetical protein